MFPEILFLKFSLDITLVQVQATDTRTKETQTGTHSVQRPDRFDADKIRSEKQISGFETMYISKS